MQFIQYFSLSSTKIHLKNVNPLVNTIHSISLIYCHLLKHILGTLPSGQFYPPKINGYVWDIFGCYKYWLVMSEEGGSATNIWWEIRQGHY